MSEKGYFTARTILAPLVRFFLGIRVHGKDNEPSREEGPYLICSNHISWIDPVMICASVGKQHPRFMAKKELFAKPVVGSLVRALGAFPVDRSGRDAGIIFKSKEMLEEGACVALFPQGTRCPGVDPKTTRIHSGAGMIAALSHTQVLPVRIVTRGNKFHFFAFKHIYIGKPISFEEYSAHGKDEKDFAGMSRYIFDRVCELNENEVR